MSEDNIRENSAQLQENIEDVPGTKKWGPNEPLRDELVPDAAGGSGVVHPAEATNEGSQSLGDTAAENRKPRRAAVAAFPRPRFPS